MVFALGLGLASDLAAAPSAIDKRINESIVRFPGTGSRTLRGYMAVGRRLRGRQPSVLVLGPFGAETGWIVRRLALGGFVALSPDLQDALTTPAAPRPLDPADAFATVAWLRGGRYATGRLALIGVGAGAALAERLAATLLPPAEVVVTLPSAAAAATARLRAAGTERPVVAGAAPWDDITAFLKEHLA